jgi:hypothetical protein
VLGLRRARPGRGQRLRLLVAFSCALRRDKLDGSESLAKKFQMSKENACDFDIRYSVFDIQKNF